VDKQAVAKRFAANLAHHQERSSLTQEALAARAEIHRTQVSELLRGNQLPRLDTLVKLAGALEIEPADLLEGISFNPAASQSGQFKITPPKKR
jgi:transcriptional regulator with XRE-family HTH domain